MEYARTKKYIPHRKQSGILSVRDGYVRYATVSLGNSERKAESSWAGVIPAERIRGCHVCKLPSGHMCFAIWNCSPDADSEWRLPFVQHSPTTASRGVENFFLWCAIFGMLYMLYAIFLILKRCKYHRADTDRASVQERIRQRGFFFLATIDANKNVEMLEIKRVTHFFPPLIVTFWKMKKTATGKIKNK